LLLLLLNLLLLLLTKLLGIVLQDAWLGLLSSAPGTV
jgi:hypothetical protein